MSSSTCLEKNIEESERHRNLLQCHEAECHSRVQVTTTDTSRHAHEAGDAEAECEGDGEQRHVSSSRVELSPELLMGSADSHENKKRHAEKLAPKRLAFSTPNNAFEIAFTGSHGSLQILLQQ